MLTRSNSREFVQIRYKLKIRFINNFSWVHLLENQVHIMFSVGGLSCFRCSVIWRYLLVLLCFCAGGISGLWYSHYIKSPRQSLCVTSELTTNGWFSWFLLGGIVLVDSRWQCLVLLESSNNKPTDCSQSSFTRSCLEPGTWNSDRGSGPRQLAPGAKSSVYRVIFTPVPLQPFHGNVQYSRVVKTDLGLILGGATY